MATLQQIAEWLVTDPEAPKYFDQILSYQTPEVQKKMLEVVRAYDCADSGGKLIPFVDPITKKDVCDYHGLDEKKAEQVYQRLVDNKLTVELQQRMGTDADLPVPEPTLRDHVAAAFDAHVPPGQE